MSLDGIRRGTYADYGVSYLLKNIMATVNGALQGYVPQKVCKQLVDKITDFNTDYVQGNDFNDTLKTFNGLNKHSGKSQKKYDAKAEKLIDVNRKLLKEKMDQLDENGKAFLPMYNLVYNLMDTSANLLETVMDSQVMYELVSRVSSIPIFDKYGHNVFRENLENKDPVTGEERGPLKPLNDLYQGINDLVMADFERQKNNYNGWEKKDEKVYLDKLKAAMDKTIDAYDRLYKVENHGQYDEYLSDPLDSFTGKDLERNRDIHNTVGGLRGQSKAIENGWPRGTLEVMGSLGMMEAHADKVLLKFNKQVEETKANIEKYNNKKNPDNDDKIRYEEYKKFLDNEEKNRKLIKAYFDDLKKVKDECWDKKVSNKEERREISEKITKFAQKHKNDKIIGYALGDIHDLGAEAGRTLRTLEQRQICNNRDFFQSLTVVMNDGNKLTGFGTKQYDDIIKDVKKISEMTKDMSYVKDILKKPEGRAAYVKLMNDLDTYITRKENEINKDKKKGKTPNKNSVTRCKIMQRVRKLVKESFGEPDIEKLMEADGNIMNEPAGKQAEELAILPQDSDAVKTLKAAINNIEKDLYTYSEIISQNPNTGFDNFIISPAYKSLYFNILKDEYVDRPGNREENDKNIDSALRNSEKNVSDLKESLGKDFREGFEANLLETVKTKTITRNELLSARDKTITDLRQKYTAENNNEGLENLKKICNILGAGNEPDKNVNIETNKKTSKKASL